MNPTSGIAMEKVTVLVLKEQVAVVILGRRFIIDRKGWFLRLSLRIGCGI